MESSLKIDHCARRCFVHGYMKFTLLRIFPIFWMVDYKKETFRQENQIQLASNKRGLQAFELTSQANDQNLTAYTKTVSTEIHLQSPTPKTGPHLSARFVIQYFHASINGNK